MMHDNPRRIGIALLLISGAVLFWLQPEQYYYKISFWMKMVLLIFLTRTKAGTALSLALWAGMVVAGRMIAYNWFD